LNFDEKTKTKNCGAKKFNVSVVNDNPDEAEESEAIAHMRDVSVHAQGDRMCREKKSPKGWPNPFFVFMYW
jgi:hypothetical protein